MIKTAFLSPKTLNLYQKLTASQRFNSKNIHHAMDTVLFDSCNKSNGAAQEIQKNPQFEGLTPLKLRDIKSPSNRPFRVSIEGNIGAGKSTLIQHFSKMDGSETYAEPIEWWRNVDGHNLLELLYKDIKQWIHVFQSYCMLTRLKIQTSQPKDSKTRVQIFERSIQNNRFCFLEVAHRGDFLSSADYSILDHWYRWVRANVDIQLDLIVYLRTTPEIVFERMKARGRPEESGVSLEYLQQLHEAHEKWLMSNDERFNTTPVLVLDADKPLEDIIAQYKQNENTIMGFDKKGKKRDVSTDRLDNVKKSLKLDDF